VSKAAAAKLFYIRPQDFISPVNKSTTMKYGIGHKWRFSSLLLWHPWITRTCPESLRPASLQELAGRISVHCRFSIADCRGV